MNIIIVSPSGRLGADKTISLDLKEVPLSAALDASCRAIGTKMHVEGNAVVIGDAVPATALKTRPGGEALRRALGKANIPSVRFDQATWAEGAQFWGMRLQTEAPEGSVLRRDGLNAVLLDTGDDQLTLSVESMSVADLLRYCAAMSDRTVWVEASAVIVGKKFPPEPVVGEGGEAARRLSDASVSKVQYDSATMQEIVPHLRSKLEAEGIKVPISLEGGEWGEPGGDDRTVNLSLKNVPYWDVLRYSAMQAGAEVRVADGGVVLAPKAKP